MNLLFLFLFFVFADESLDLSTTPSINQVLEIKFENFNPVTIDGINAYAVETTIKNTDGNFPVENVILKLNIFNKRLELIGSKIVKVDFTVRKPLQIRKSYFQLFLNNLKNFSLKKDNLRNKMHEKIGIGPKQSKKFTFYFYKNDINAKLKDLTPNNIGLSPISAILRK